MRHVLLDGDYCNNETPSDRMKSFQSLPNCSQQNRKTSFMLDLGGSFDVLAGRDHSVF